MSNWYCNFFDTILAKTDRVLELNFAGNIEIVRV